MDVGRYRHNYEGFYEKTSYEISINRERTISTQGAHASLVRILTMQALVKSVEEEIQPSGDRVDTLEARHLNSFKNSFKETYKYIFSFILDDKIICYWWLGVLNI